jgi:hypothetical protein
LCVGNGLADFAAPGAESLMSTRESLCQVWDVLVHFVDELVSNAAVSLALILMLAEASNLKSLHFQLIVSTAS